VSSETPLDESRGNYYQFPLCILAMSNDRTETLLNIAAYCCGKLGSEIMERCGDVVNLKQNEVENYRDAFGELPPGFNWSDGECDESAVSFVVAASRLGYRIYSLPELMKRHAEAMAHVSAFESRHGRDASIRIHPDLFDEAGGDYRSNGLLTFPEFRLLCAILSFMPREEKLKWIAPTLLAPRMLGFKSEDVMLAECRGVQPRLLHRTHIGKLTESLEAKGAIRGRYTWNRQRTYYSTRLTSAELEQRVEAEKSARKIIPFPASSVKAA
jgi:hypothetical protein